MYFQLSWILCYLLTSGVGQSLHNSRFQTQIPYSQRASIVTNKGFEKRFDALKNEALEISVQSSVCNAF